MKGARQSDSRKILAAMEKAVNILVKVRREWEEDYLRQTDPPAAEEEKADG